MNKNSKSQLAILDLMVSSHASVFWPGVLSIACWCNEDLRSVGGRACDEDLGGRGGVGGGTNMTRHFSREMDEK